MVHAPALPPLQTTKVQRGDEELHRSSLCSARTTRSTKYTATAHEGSRSARTIQGGTISKSQHLTEAKEPASFQRGADVVDVCTGQRGYVLGVTKTHCKVFFADAKAKWKLEANETNAEVASTLILPLGRLILLTPQWDVSVATSTAGPTILPQKTVEQPAPALPGLICVAAPQALCTKETPYSPRHKRLLSNRFESDCSSASDEEGTFCGASSRHHSAQIEKTPGQQALEHFKSFCRSSYGGSLVAAWKLALDPRGNGRISYQEFVRGGRQMGFSGNYSQAWSELVKDLPSCQDFITLATLDTPTADLFEQICFFFEREEITLEDLWENILDPDGSGRCPRYHWMEVLTGFGFSKDIAKRAFKMLDMGREDDVTLNELELLGLKHRTAQFDMKLSHREVGLLHDAKQKQRVLADFHGFLLRNYGSVVRAWRLALHKDGIGKLNFTQFCASCKKIGFRGKLQTLWKALDAGGSGFVSLGSLDQEAETAMDEFRSLLEENYRTLEDAWERVLDPDRSGKCTEQEFIAACKLLRWSGNALRLFKWLDFHARHELALDDLAILGMRRKRAESSSAAARQQLLLRQEKDRAEAESMLGKFKVFLVQRHGNLIRAWRKELDPDEEDSVQFTEFCQACRQMGFQGNLKALWLSLDRDDSGEIRLKDLDPEGVSYLEDFRRILETFFGDLDSAWYCHFDLDSNGRCSQEEFIRDCRNLGFLRSSAQLYRYLDVRNDGHVSLDQLNVLKLPRAASKEEAMVHVNETGAKLYWALESILANTFIGGLVNGWRHGFCSGPPELQWLEELGVEEFCARCHALGFKGNLHLLWTEIHGPVAKKQRPGESAGPFNRRRTRRSSAFNRKSVNSHEVNPAFWFDNGARQMKALGKISLAQFAPALHEELAAFRVIAEKRFDSCDELWHAMLVDHLKKDPDSRLRRAEFTQAVRFAIGFRGDTDLVFDVCDLDCKHSISLQDFRFLQIGSAAFHAKVADIQEPSAPTAQSRSSFT